MTDHLPSPDDPVAKAFNEGENRYRQTVLSQGPLPGYPVIERDPPSSLPGVREPEEPSETYWSELAAFEKGIMNSRNLTPEERAQFDAVNAKYRRPLITKRERELEVALSTAHATAERTREELKHAHECWKEQCDEVEALRVACERWVGVANENAMRLDFILNHCKAFISCTGQEIQEVAQIDAAIRYLASRSVPQGSQADAD